MKTNQAERILRHLKDYRTIEPMEALGQYGCYRLADVIYRLKKEGHNITTELVVAKNKYGELTRHAKYCFVKPRINFLTTHNK